MGIRIVGSSPPRLKVLDQNGNEITGVYEITIDTIKPCQQITASLKVSVDEINLEVEEVNVEKFTPPFTYSTSKLSRM